MSDEKRDRRIARHSAQIVQRVFDRLQETNLVDESALAVAEEDAEKIVANEMSGLDFQDLWWEFLNGRPPSHPDLGPSFCGLCGQSGYINTAGICTPAGVPCGGRFYCICPNGRALKAAFGVPAGGSSLVP